MARFQLKKALPFHLFHQNIYGNDMQIPKMLISFESRKPSNKNGQIKCGEIYHHELPLDTIEYRLQAYICLCFFPIFPSVVFQNKLHNIAFQKMFAISDEEIANRYCRNVLESFVYSVLFVQLVAGIN